MVFLVLLVIAVIIAGAIIRVGKKRATQKTHRAVPAKQPPPIPSVASTNAVSVGDGCPEGMCQGHILPSGYCSACGMRRVKIINPSQPPRQSAESSERPHVSLTKYSMDIDARSCGCPDWLKTRSGYFRGEPQRLCKHLVKALVQEELHKEYGSEANQILRASEKRIGYYPTTNDNWEEFTKAERGKILRNYFGSQARIDHEPAVIKAYGDRYLYNLSMVESRTRDGASTVYVPWGDHYRWRFEMLARLGTARRVAQMTPKELLEGLSMSDLRLVVSKLLNGAKIRSKQEGRDRLITLGLPPAKFIPDGQNADDYFRIEAPNLDDVIRRSGSGNG